ncbi:hypothetical protein [Paraburkholderia adhaesiva]|uniref:hypothetical protein n=1 Tax=Paraburkholderia adhaesiva TaxID=2883244 RepID=UPI001F3CDCB8|nr:hypothetical protein [Paraburkholderia adhaesiva]
MKIIPSSRNGHEVTYARGDANSLCIAVDFRVRRQVDDLCIALFDHWCERRELIPLVYLLHVWPFLPSTPHAVATLSAALRDLLVFHDETIDDRGRQLIDGIHTLHADEI